MIDDGILDSPDDSRGSDSRRFVERMRRLRPGQPATGSFDSLALPPPLIPGLDGLEPAASGGTGIVYRARDSATGAAVAVKVLLKGASWSIPMRARARREAEILAGIDHPNVVRVRSAGEVRGAPGWPDGLPYIVMEWIEGDTLQRLVGRRIAPVRESVKIARDVARALDAVHSRGIVHRDVKPANILFTTIAGEPTPKLIDFGLAREGGGSASSGSTAVGTPGYMAPEQTRVDGSLGAVGPAADVFGLGATLFFLLHGRPPYASTTAAETLSRAVAGAVDWSRPASGAIPMTLRVIMEKCLERQPVRRYPSAGALADDLDRFLAGRPPLARRAPLARRLLAQARLRPAVATAIVLGAVGTLAAGAGLWWHLESLRRARNTAIAARDHSLEALARLTDASVERMVARGAAFDEADSDYLRGILALYRDWPLDPDPVPALRDRVAGLLRLATIFTRVSRIDDAAECFREALEDCAALDRAGADANETSQLRLDVLRDQGRTFSDAGRPEDAEAPLREAIEVARRLPGTASHTTDSVVGPIGLQLATIVHRLGRQADAKRLADEALESLVRARCARPDDYGAARDELVALHYLGTVVAEPSGVDAQRGRLRELIARTDACLERFPDHVAEIEMMRVVAMTRLFDVENSAGNGAVALGLAEQLLEDIYRDLDALADGEGGDGRRSFLRNQAVFLATRVMGTLTSLGRTAEPSPLLPKSLAIGRVDQAAEPARVDHVIRLAEALQAWRDLHRAAGRPEEALEAGREMLAILDPWIGKPEFRELVDSLAADAHAEIGTLLLRDLHDPGEAVSSLRRAIGFEPLPSHPEWTLLLAEALHEAGDSATAREAAMSVAGDSAVGESAHRLLEAIDAAAKPGPTGIQ